MAAICTVKLYSSHYFLMSLQRLKPCGHFIYIYSLVFTCIGKIYLIGEHIVPPQLSALSQQDKSLVLNPTGFTLDRGGDTSCIKSALIFPSTCVLANSINPPPCCCLNWLLFNIPISNWPHSSSNAGVKETNGQAGKKIKETKSKSTQAK